MKRLPLIGKVGAEWIKVRKELKVLFERRGITYCEAHFRTCTVNAFLGFAHILKRRHLGRWESTERAYNIRQVALLCNNCHDALELRGELVGGREISRIIDGREGVNLLEDL